MANTVTQRTLMGGGSDKNIYRLVHIISDGTEESDLVVYNNSDFVADTAKGNLKQIWVSGDASVIRLEWDQTADSPAFTCVPGGVDHIDFRHFGGISNPNGSGATGDLVLTSVDLDAGDELSLIIHIDQT